MKPEHPVAFSALQRLCAGLGLALAALLQPAFAADPNEFSQAEKLVFTDHHLANVKGPANLRYRFVKSGPLEPGYEDDVSVDLDAARNVKGSFLSGARSMKLPEIELAEANPVILYFLEHDIRDMERLTKGKAAYFRKRIRMAMVDDASVSETRIVYNGSEVPAFEVRLSPYAKDPARARYDRYADKRYTFVLSKAVPGGVYQVRTLLPGAAPGDAPSIEEVLTLATAGAARTAAAPSDKPVKP
jgi:hypothetical protein